MSSLEPRCLMMFMIVTLNHGDLYIMAHKAIGNDYFKENIVTWRHARGSPTCKYSKVKPKHTKIGKTIVKRS
jgi:hypothetical protein